MLYISKPRVCAPPIGGLTARHCVCVGDNCIGSSVSLSDENGNTVSARVVDTWDVQPCSATMAHMCAIGEAWACQQVNRIEYALIDYEQYPSDGRIDGLGVVMSHAWNRLYAWLLSYAPRVPNRIRVLEPSQGQQVLMYVTECLGGRCRIAQVKGVVNRITYTTVYYMSREYCYYPVMEILLPREVYMSIRRYAFSGSLVMPGT